MKKYTFLLILPLFLGLVFSGCCHKKEVVPAPAPEVVAPAPPPPPEPAPEPAPAPAPEPIEEKG